MINKSPSPLLLRIYTLRLTSDHAIDSTVVLSIRSTGVVCVCVDEWGGGGVRDAFEISKILRLKVSRHGVHVRNIHADGRARRIV